jgi:hypothetical protein
MDHVSAIARIDGLTNGLAVRSHLERRETPSERMMGAALRFAFRNETAMLEHFSRFSCRNH